jgi:hypothetical protein
MNRYLIVGGIAWILFWTFHTIAHGPSNPSPRTGRFLGLSSDYYGYLAMVIASPLLAIGWVKQFKFPSFKGNWLIYTSIIVGLIGLLTLFCIGVLGLFQTLITFGNQYDGLLWYFYIVGLLLVIICLIIYGIGLFKVKKISIWFKVTPWLMILLPFVFSVLRQPNSPLLEKGDFFGFLLLELVGGLFGLGWIILGIAMKNITQK